VTRVLFAGGGTAGHIEPALAVAREWRAQHSDSSITFVGTREGLESRLVPDAGFAISYITKVRIARSLSPSLLVAPFSLLRSVVQSVALMRQKDLVVGFGGYVSGPIYLAAALTRTPIVIHEANARPGIANRLGALFTPHTAITHSIDSGTLSDSLLAGLPLREDVVSAYRSASHDWQKARRIAKAELGFDSTKPLIFIFGGSQGSVALNTVIAESRQSLLAEGVQILHGIGARNEVPSAADGYEARGYITDMATAYLGADLIISRSGAVTCAEVNTLGKFALFIPLPIGNGEQHLNARDLVSQSRAEILPQNQFTSTWITANIKRLLALSATAPMSGSDVDINAASKMVSLMEYALHGGKA
jgi:UDP-N-acetylglucosamine--N-acetylmuramyl-(pentapeptide) pyrophosphoryl-undecaprenol N-acetylglucosamine transferase